MWRRPSRTKVVRAAIACGWSPLGEYSDDNRNTASATSGRGRDGEEIFSPRVEQRVRVRMPEHVRREHELRMHRLADEAHPDLVGESGAPPEIAAQAGRAHAPPRRPRPPAAARQRVGGGTPRRAGGETGRRAPP